VLSIRLIAAAERFGRDPGGAAIDVIVIVIVVAAIPSIFVLINRYRARDARGRRERLREMGRAGWLADATLDAQTRGVLGITGADGVRSFALVQTDRALEFWGRVGLVADAAIGWDRVVSVEPSII
jgi:hypothetical protein